MVTFTLAGGCFWCLDAVFRQLVGVSQSISGYTGGSADEADYYQVATGKTAHAEAVQVSFNESLLPIDDLLDIYFLIHDPTTKNRQGNDVGTQYRSAMFYADQAQLELFQSAIQRAQAVYEQPVVTELSPLAEFYPAEPEHQDYFANNPAQPYCTVVVSPKVAKARQHYSQYFKVIG